MPLKPLVMIGPKTGEAYNRMKYLVRTKAYHEFEILGHVFGIPTATDAHQLNAQYIRQTHEAKKLLFCGMVDVEYFNDVDLSLNLMKEDGAYERWLLRNYGTRLVPF